MKLFNTSEIGTSTPLESNAGFLLTEQGYYTVALKLPRKVVKKISGQGMERAGILSKLKEKLGHVTDTEAWWIVTSVENPSLGNTGEFQKMIADSLTTATGTAVDKSNIAISASIKIVGSKQSSFEENQMQPQTISNP